MNFAESQDGDTVSVIPVKVALKLTTSVDTDVID